MLRLRFRPMRPRLPWKSSQPDTSTALKRQKAKKARKDTPARIISLPVPGEKPKPEAAPQRQETPAAPARRAPRVIDMAKVKAEEKPAPAPEKEKAKVKKKRAKKPGGAEDDAKKKGFRKKEIREGAELYAGKDTEGGLGTQKERGQKRCP